MGLAYWSGLAQFEPGDAAYLLHGEEPKSLGCLMEGAPGFVRDHDRKIEHTLTELRREFCPCADRPISRDALVLWASAHGLRPLCLFPEDRESAPSMRVDTREGLLLLIGLLTHALAENGGNALSTDKGPNQSAIIKELNRVANKLGVPKEGLSKSMLSERLQEALAEVNNRKPSNTR